MKTNLCNLSDTALASILRKPETNLNRALLREAAIEIEHRAQLRAARQEQQEQMIEVLRTPSRTLRAFEGSNTDWY